MPPSAGTAPPARPVPEPRGTIGTLARLAALTTAATCSTSPGSDDDLRHDLKDRAVLLVDDHVFLFDEHVAIADDGAQFAISSPSLAVRSLADCGIRCQLAIVNSQFSTEAGLLGWQLLILESAS